MQFLEAGATRKRGVLRRQYVQIFLSTFCLLMLETVFFHLLLFTHDYLESTLVISYALLGLGVGAIVARFYRPRRGIDFPLLIVLLIGSIVAVFASITRVPHIVGVSPLLMTPFLVGNVIVTCLYRSGDASRLYYFDLVGATCGIFFCVAFIPLLKAEGTLVLSVAVLALAGLVFNETGSRSLGYRVAFTLIGVLSVLTITFNQQSHVLDLERIARSETKDYYRAVSNGLDYLISEDNLVSRISIIAEKPDPNPYRSFDGSLDRRVAHAYYNGSSNDVLDSAPVYAFRNDPRIPFMYYADGGQHLLFRSRPQVLIIGSAAQGIVKSVKFLVADPSRIDAVEINPAIVHLMSHELYAMSGEAYRDVDVHIMDARTYLRHTRRRYDLITMLNTYTAEAIGYFGEPDFVHTTNAIDQYLDHLNAGGYLLFEERGVTRRGYYAIFRLLNNIMSVLEGRAVDDPGTHLFIYSVNDKNMNPNDWYTFIVVGKSAIAGKDREFFARWLLSRHHIEYDLKEKQSPDMDATAVYHTRPEFLPGEYLQSDYTRFIESGQRERFFGDSVRLKATTDDNPYIFDVMTDRPGLRRILVRMSIPCAAILVGALLLLTFSRKEKLSGRHVVLSFYFLVLGFGYFIIEIMLMKLYQSMTGSPTASLVFVLGGLLLSSGIGGRLSRRSPTSRVILSLLGIVLLSLYHVFLNRDVLTFIGGPVWVERILVTASILPLGFLLGVPFPWGIERVRLSISEEQIPTFIAMNSVASSFGIVLGLFLSVVFGFVVTTLAGAAFYALAVLVPVAYLSQ